MSENQSDIVIKYTSIAQKVHPWTLLDCLHVRLSLCHLGLGRLKDDSPR